MKVCFLAIVTLLGFIRLSAQSSYFQQALQYTIDAELNDKEKAIKGFETIVYKNNSPDTLAFIWFHIWPNAYRNDGTALFQQLKNDPSRKQKLRSGSYGAIDGLLFKANGIECKTAAHPNNAYIDIIKVLLPQSLLPGDSVTITTPFLVKLPAYFSRSGYADGEFMACQWYPKPAVYDNNGWHEMPYLDMGEFYSEYASYKVTITVPAAYVVGATGTLQNKEELEAYKKIGTANYAAQGAQVMKYKPISTAKKTLLYTAAQVPDFAWFADKEFIIQYDTLQLSTGTTVDAFTYYHPKKNTNWVKSVDDVKDAVRKYSQWIGEYPYPVVQAVEGPKNNSSGGMEYPTITLITSPDSNPESLDGVIAHEVGHNWFMSVFGTNEREHPWMDEGLNTYFQFRYEAEKYRTNSIIGKMIPEKLKSLSADEFQRAVYNALLQVAPQTPIETPSANFASSDDYGLTEYIKTAVWMYIIEESIGKEEVDKAFQYYYDHYKFKHPQPEDLKACFEQVTGKKMNLVFNLLNKEGKLI
ncbi:MAG: M1 family metallopeptidase [Bacteroidota bacterium]|nr:M1 family metallopeptidase [Bacteroidota bacterium]